jgi:hypothetical protein
MSMVIRAVSTLRWQLATLLLCALAAGIALFLNLTWLDYVGVGSARAPNFFPFVLFDVTPVAIYGLIALLGRNRRELVMITCLFAGLTGFGWLGVALIPVHEVPDPEIHIKLFTSVVAVLSWFPALILGFLLAISLFDQWTESK